MRRTLIILVAAMFLVFCSGARRPALALNKTIALSLFSVGSLGFSTLAYYIWKNSPAQRAKGYPESLGPGEWYVGAYSGLSLLPPADWQLLRGFPPELAERTVKQMVYRPGVLGGIKFGRYFDALPWAGIEVETNFSRNAILGQRARFSPPLPGGQIVNYTSDRFYIWDMQINLLARYGFLKDKEVTFGRLQPYAGIGPGFEVIYGTTDSAKNFAIEVLAGLRYMCTDKIALFCEYKFSYQFQVEYEQVHFPGFRPNGTVTFDVPHHRIAFGVSYHFKNLFGN